VVDDISDDDWDRLYKRAESSESPNDIQGWLYKGDTSPHKVKWGERNGKQRYRTVISKPISYGTITLSDVLFKPKEIRNKLQKTEEPKELKNLSDETDEIRIYSLSNEIKGEIKARLKEIVFTKTDGYIDSYDISGFKNLRDEVKDPELNKTIGNYEFNMFRAKRMELRDKGDLSGLDRLKTEVKGARDESELLNDIDYDINKLKR